jgi:hypothetical protein
VAQRRAHLRQAGRISVIRCGCEIAEVRRGHAATRSQIQINLTQQLEYVFI